MRRLRRQAKGVRGSLRQMDTVIVLDGRATTIRSECTGPSSQAKQASRLRRAVEGANTVDHRPNGVSILVNGLPIAQPRHRASCRGGFARLYLPKDHAVHAWKDAIVQRAGAVIENAFEGPLRVDLLFGFKCRRKIEVGHYRVCKPDLDNLAKATLDALTDAGAWNDDAQVAQLHLAKVYAKEPFVQIRIDPLNFHAVAST